MCGVTLNINIINSLCILFMTSGMPHYQHHHLSVIYLFIFTTVFFVMALKLDLCLCVTCVLFVVCNKCFFRLLEDPH